MVIFLYFLMIFLDFLVTFFGFLGELCWISQDGRRISSRDPGLNSAAAAHSCKTTNCCVLAKSKYSSKFGKNPFILNCEKSEYFSYWIQMWFPLGPTNRISWWLSFSFSTGPANAYQNVTDGGLFVNSPSVTIVSQDCNFRMNHTTPAHNEKKF